MCVRVYVLGEGCVCVCVEVLWCFFSMCVCGGGGEIALTLTVDHLRIPGTVGAARSSVSGQVAGVVGRYTRYLHALVIVM